MFQESMSARKQVQSTGSIYKKGMVQPREDFPFEVITLLNVFARIEVRRRMKLSTEGKVV